MSQPRHAAGEIASVLPRRVAQALDWSTLRLEKTSFVPPSLREFVSDVLYSIRLAGSEQEAYVFLLFEHQSTQTPLMAFRLLQYACSLWQRYADQNPKTSTLPLVIPLVLYHHESRPWEQPTRLSACFDAPERLREALGDHLIDFEFLLDDLTQHSEDELLSRALSAFARLVLLSLKLGRGEPVLTRTAHWARLLAEASKSDGLQAVLALCQYHLSTGASEPTLIDILMREEGVPVSVQQTYKSLADQLQERGEQRGLERGRLQGRLQGRAEALLAVLRARGLAVTQSAESRILECDDPELLERWLQLAVTIDAAEELFAAS